MALLGSRKKFDENGDGKLNYQEWWRWYRSTSGPAIEQKHRSLPAGKDEKNSSYPEICAQRLKAGRN